MVDLRNRHFNILVQVDKISIWLVTQIEDSPNL